MIPSASSGKRKNFQSLLKVADRLKFRSRVVHRWAHARADRAKDSRRAGAVSRTVLKHPVGLVRRTGVSGADVGRGTWVALLRAGRQVSVLVDVLAGDELEHRLVAEAALGAFFAKLVDELLLEHDRPRS